MLSELLDAADDAVVGSAASCLAALTIEVDSKLPVMSSAGEGLIKRAKEGKPVSSSSLTSAAK